MFLLPRWARRRPKPAGQSAATADGRRTGRGRRDTCQSSRTPPPASPPANTGEGWLEGSFEIGYRWIPNITGNFDAYRSVVNFGEGPRLLDADFTVRDPKKRLFDRVDVHATSWGDPYNTLRVDMQKQGWYRLTADYRNIAYFNFLPSYADPHAEPGNAARSELV